MCGKLSTSQFIEQYKWTPTEKSVGVISLLSAYQIFVLTGRRGRRPLQEISNFLMRRSLCGVFLLLIVELRPSVAGIRAESAFAQRSLQTVYTAIGGILPGEEMFHSSALNHAKDQSPPRAANSVCKSSHWAVERVELSCARLAKNSRQRQVS